VVGNYVYPDCLFVGEKLIEVLGALAASMKAVLKPCPPGREVSGCPVRNTLPTHEWDKAQ
jgi:hypothetical protein